MLNRSACTRRHLVETSLVSAQHLKLRISFGLGIPAGGLFSNVNTTVEFGKRGTTNENLVEENFVNFQLSLSLNDRWFIKRKYN